MRSGRWRIATAVVLAAALEVVVGAQTPPPPLTFAQALDLASTRNLAVVAARRARAIREAGIVTAGLRPNPDITAEVSRDAPHEAVGIDIPFEFGQRRRRLDLAREELLLADVDVQTELRAVRRELREAFYSLIFADQRLQLTDSLLDIARRLRDTAQARVDSGAAPRLEVLQADLEVVRAESEVDLAHGLRASAQARLNGILDRPPAQATVVAGSLDDGITTVAIEEADAQFRANNPELAGLERQIAVEQRRVDLLRAERTPAPVFSIGGVFDAPGEFSAGLRAGVSVGLPIFNRNQGEIAASVATASQLRARRDALARTLENSVYASVQDISARRSQVDAFRQRLVPTASELATLSEESYRAGRSTILGVLEAERSVRELSEEALQASLDLQLALAELEELIGAPLP
jgi:cobalt-zinc-cadmium efflux system outer membrane protein